MNEKLIPLEGGGYLGWGWIDKQIFIGRMIQQYPDDVGEPWPEDETQPAVEEIDWLWGGETTDESGYPEYHWSRVRGKPGFARKCTLFYP